MYRHLQRDSIREDQANSFDQSVDPVPFATFAVVVIFFDTRDFLLQFERISAAKETQSEQRKKKLEM
jgi:hypothetical protein